MKGFMKVICVILCLIISTSVPAYAGSIMWATKQSSTNLVKDEQWILSVATEEDSIIEGTTVDDVDSTADDGVEIIDAMIVVEGTEATPLEAIEPQETLTEATDPTEELIEPPVEDTPTPDEIKPQEEDLVDEPDHIEETGE